ncbi:MAG: hypothetical protein Q9210_001332 [Variospora velana]
MVIEKALRLQAATPFEPPNSHKRWISNSEAPKTRFQPQNTPSGTGRFADPSTVNGQYVYIAVKEQFGAYMETEQTFHEVYATLEDANHVLLWRQKEAADYEELWEDQGVSYDSHGCLNARAEDDEGNGLTLRIERLLVNPPGTVPHLPTRDQRR